MCFSRIDKKGIIKFQMKFGESVYNYEKGHYCITDYGNAVNSG